MNSLDNELYAITIFTESLSDLPDTILNLDVSNKLLRAQYDQLTKELHS